MLDYFWIIPLPVLLTLLLTLVLGNKIGLKSAWLGMCGTTASFVLAVCCAPAVFGGGETAEVSFRWFEDINCGFLLDNLSLILLLLVSFLATLILLYAYGYMEHESGLLRFFAEVQLFVFSMLSVLLSNNLLQAFIFWEIMGLCSYLLIGFWFFKPSAAAAAKKAFLVTRVGDVIMLVGILLLHNMFGSFDYNIMIEQAGAGNYDPTWLTVSMFCIFGGVIGKSAQFPLHVWLPDAMEGPTPVSALIHAATMVKAGIYLCARLFPLFALTPKTTNFMIAIGTITALGTALMAMVNRDFKRILAFSTLSQLGFMVVALGTLNYVAAVLHLLNHAFFKALLFMGAGSAIHGTGTNDIYEMGGLLKYQKVTGLTILAATVSIAGIPPFSGFWSKDEILLAAYHSSQLSFWLLALTSFLTAFYMFRLFFVVFTGPKLGDYHGHESSLPMILPLMILSVFALGSGILTKPVSMLLAGEVEAADTHFPMLVSICVVALGVGLSAAVYFFRVIDAAKVAAAVKPIHTLLLNRYYIDRLYEKLSALVAVSFAAVADLFDKYVIDGLVNLVAWVCVRLADFCRWFDYNVVDGVIRGFCFVVAGFGRYLRGLTAGNAQGYLAVVLGGVFVLLLAAMGGVMFL
jgi:NADH-quinone oxidoreductase subunit L